MKKQFVFAAAFLLTLLFTNKSLAQVKGLSYTISPMAEYNWWNEKSGLKNGYLGGGQLGFGFGEFVELRGTYLQGFNLETDVNNFGLDVTDAQTASYNAREVNLRRYGGEMKLNLGRGVFLPYLTVGTGIQEMSLDTFANNKNLYYSTGLGIKLSAANRYTLGIEGVRTSYSSNAINRLMTAEDHSLLNVTPGDYVSENLANYAVRASLVFYLGGRKPGTYTDIDKAYMDNFSGGFRGLSIPLEPTVQKMDFNENLPYRDTYMFGGSAGINLGPLVGLRGFYWHALEDGSTSKFDELYMYGGEGRFKLNEGKGFTPWITLGGGEIVANEGYVNANDDALTEKQKNAFVTGGLGLDLPFSKYFKATGFVRSYLTSNKDAVDVSKVDDLNASYSYGVSLNFILGQKPKRVSRAKQEAFDNYILSTQEEYDANTEELKAEYDERIADLEQQLEEAVDNRDNEAVKEISEEKERVEDVLESIEKEGYNRKGDDGISRREMRDMIDDALAQEQREVIIEKETSSYDAKSAVDQAIKEMKAANTIERLEEKVAMLKEQVADLQRENSELERDADAVQREMADTIKDYEEVIKELEEEIEALEKEVEKKEIRMEALNSKAGAAEGAPAGGASVDAKLLEKDIAFLNERISNLQDNLMESLRDIKKSTRNTEVNVEKMPSRSGNNVVVEEGPSNTENVKVSNRLYNRATGIFSKLRYNGMSAFAGFGVGGNTTFNVGYRLHYDIDDMAGMHFVPETFFGFGSPSNFGISANAIYDLPFMKKQTRVNPYAGLGLGLMKVGDKTNEDQLKGAFNIIIGTSLDVWRGDLYVDLTARNLFKYNQLMVGYRLPF